MSVPWTAEQIADRWRLEIRERFERENAEHRAEDEADIQRVLTKQGDDDEFRKLYPSVFEVHDSPHWVLYQSCVISIYINAVVIALPAGHFCTTEFVEMFDDTMVSWTKVLIDAEPADDDGRTTRVALSTVLVNSWDDERAAGWSDQLTGELFSFPC